jgi:hypothetical protein
MLGMRALGAVKLAGLGQPLQRESMDRLQQSCPWFSVRAVGHRDQADIISPLTSSNGSAGSAGPAPARATAASASRSQPPSKPLRAAAPRQPGGRQQVVAPGNGGPQGLLALWPPGRATADSAA